MIFKFLVAQYFVANANYVYFYVKKYVSYVSVTVCNLIEINYKLGIIKISFEMDF